MRLRVYQVDFRRTKDGWEARKGKYRVKIVGDAVHRGMWRIVREDGTLSDMVNLTRAKDAALGLIEGREFVNAPVPD
jgi:hypothetical protein